MKNTVFWDVTPCGFCENRRIGGTYRLHHYGDYIVFLRSVFLLLVTANSDSCHTDNGADTFLRNVGS
jgi:hypothetical protein